jgi:hypothetical protein
VPVAKPSRSQVCAADLYMRNDGDRADGTRPDRTGLERLHYCLYRTSNFFKKESTKLKMMTNTQTDRPSIDQTKPTSHQTTQTPLQLTVPAGRHRCHRLRRVAAPAPPAAPPAGSCPCPAATAAANARRLPVLTEETEIMIPPPPPRPIKKSRSLTRCMSSRANFSQ